MKQAPFFAVGFLVGALAVGLWQWSKSDQPNNAKDIFYKREIDRLQLNEKVLQSKNRLWTNYVQKLTDSLKYEQRKTKIIDEKYIRLRSRRLPIYTDSQLDSAINAIIRYR